MNRQHESLWGKCQVRGIGVGNEGQRENFLRDGTRAGFYRWSRSTWGGRGLEFGGIELLQ